MQKTSQGIREIRENTLDKFYSNNYQDLPISSRRKTLGKMNDEIFWHENSTPRRYNT